MASKACINRLQKEYKAILKVRMITDSHKSSLQHNAGLGYPSAQYRVPYHGRALLTLQEPVPNIKACPSPTNLLEWHYALEGVKGTSYEGGVYHGCVAHQSCLLLFRDVECNII